MSIIERSASPQAPAAGSKPRGGRLRVITAGSVGNMEARLGTSGFDVVAVAETEEALIDAVSADEADAIVVEADLCDSLERVRDLAPNALLIVIGDHTPAGALGRIEPGVSGTVMAGLLHALVAEGVGGAVGWGLVPALGPRGVLQVPQRISGWLLSAKADLVREYVANAFRDHAELLTAASTVAVTVSASLVLTLSAAHTHERPHERSERVQVPASAVERAPQVPAGGVSPTTPTPAYVPSQNEGEPGDRRGRTAVSQELMVAQWARTPTIWARSRTLATIWVRSRPPPTIWAKARTPATTMARARTPATITARTRTPATSRPGRERRRRSRAGREHRRRSRQERERRRRSRQGRRSGRRRERG